MVETLMLRNRSPPVPQVSMTSSPAGSSRGTAWATMARTNPVISSTVSPLARSATASAAICAGEAWPDRTSPNTVSACWAVREVPTSNEVNRPGHPPKAPKSCPEAAGSEMVGGVVSDDVTISPTTGRGRAHPGR